MYFITNKINQVSIGATAKVSKQSQQKNPQRHEKDHSQMHKLRPYHRKEKGTTKFNKNVL